MNAGGAAGSRARIPRAEWVVAGLSALVILGAAGFLAARGARPAMPPDLVASIDTVSGGDGRWSMRVRVENRGDRTAAGVEVEGTLEPGGETGGFTLDYVAGHSTAHGTLLFGADPRTRRLALRVRGYADP